MMISSVLLFWLGLQVQTPAWYFGIAAFLFFANLIGFILKIVEKRRE